LNATHTVMRVLCAVVLSARSHALRTVCDTALRSPMIFTRTPSPAIFVR